MNYQISKSFYNTSKTPKDWKQKKLKHIFSISENKSLNFIDEKILSLTQKGIIVKDITTNKGQIAESYEKYILVKKGQICMNPMDLLTGWVDISSFEGLISPAYYTLILNKEIDNKFINYFLQSNYYQKTFFKLCKGVASHDNFGRWVLTPEELKNVYIFLPKLEEQKKISDYISKKTEKINSLIKSIKEKIKLLKQQQMSLINQCITRGLDPNVEIKDTGIEWIGKIPKHWIISKLKWVTTKIGSGVTPRGGSEVYSDTGIPFLRSQNIHFDGLHLDDVVHISEEIEQSMKGSRVKKNDILYNITGGSIGRCCLVYSEQLMNVNQHVCIVRPSDKITSEYLRTFLISELGQNQLRMNLTGSGREGLNFENLGNFLIPLIPHEEQKKIGEQVKKFNETFFELQSKLKNKILKLNEYRQSLVTSMVTGKVRIMKDML